MLKRGRLSMPPISSYLARPTQLRPRLTCVSSRGGGDVVLFAVGGGGRLGGAAEAAGRAADAVGDGGRLGDHATPVGGVAAECDLDRGEAVAEDLEVFEDGGVEARRLGGGLAEVR